MVGVAVAAGNGGFAKVNRRHRGGGMTQRGAAGVHQMGRRLEMVGVDAAAGSGSCRELGVAANFDRFEGYGD